MINKIIIFLVTIFPVISIAVQCNSTGNENNICSPIGADIGTIGELLGAILKGVTYMAIPLIVLAFIYSGFKFVTANGDSTAISEAKKVILYTIIGTVIILGSNVILEVVTNTTKDFMEPGSTIGQS